MKRKKIIMLILFAIFLLVGTSTANAEIKIGMGSILTGPFAAWGLGPKVAMEMAIEEINAAGGINGEKVLLITRDDGLDTTKAALQAEELVFKEKIDVYFPSSITGSAKATIPVCTKAGIPAIIAAQSSDITCPKTCVSESPNCCNPLVFRFSTLVSNFADAMVKMARDKLHGKRIALMHDNIGYGLEWKEDITAAAKRNNIKLAASEMFPLMEVDYTASLMRVKETKADVIVVGTLGAPAGRIYNAMKKLGMKQPLLLCEAATEIAFRTTAENMGDGAYVAMKQNSSSDTPNADFAAFSKKYSQRAANLGYTDVFTTTSNDFQYYDTMKCIAYVMGKYGKKPDNIRKGLETMGPYKGISGITYVFSKNQHNGMVHLPVQLFQFHNGKILPVK